MGSPKSRVKFDAVAKMREEGDVGFPGAPLLVPTYPVGVHPEALTQSGALKS